MFTINDKTKINVKTNDNISIREITHNLFDKSKTSNIDYTYFGKHVSKGAVSVATSKGVRLVCFDEKNGYAREVTIY